MSEISLSSDLTRLAIEIKGFKSNIGYSFFEIGRRLKIAKENNAGYGEWVTFLEEVNFSRGQADKLIVIYEEYSNNKLVDVEQIGLSVAYEIATLPEEEKQEQLQRIEKGDSPTVRELREVKRQLKQQAQALEEKERVIEEQQQALSNPKVEVQVKEVIPEDYEQLKRINRQLKEEYQRLLNERAKIDEQSTKYEELTRFIQEAEGKLSETQQKIAGYQNVHKLLKEANEFLSKASALAYTDISRAIIEDSFVKQEFQALLNNLERFQKNIQSFTDQNIIEGEIIND